MERAGRDRKGKGGGGSGKVHYRQYHLREVARLNIRSLGTDLNGGEVEHDIKKSAANLSKRSKTENKPKKALLTIVPTLIIFKGGDEEEEEKAEKNKGRNEENYKYRENALPSCPPRQSRNTR